MYFDGGYNPKKINTPPRPFQRLCHDPPRLGLSRLGHRVLYLLRPGLPPPNRAVDLSLHLLRPSPLTSPVPPVHFPLFLDHQPIHAEIRQPQTHHHVVVRLYPIPVQLAEQILIIRLRLTHAGVKHKVPVLDLDRQPRQAALQAVLFTVGVVGEN